MWEFYNVPHYARAMNVELRRSFRGMQLRVGHRAPDFRLPTVRPEGELCLSDALESGPLALVFGCLSAPPCVRELPKIDALGSALGGSGARIAMVYTREIHPGESIPVHRSMAQKQDAARRLKDELGLSLTVAVDELDGATHRAYGGLPFMSVVVDRGGLVVHRSEWASALQLAMVLENLAARDARPRGDLPDLVSYCETLFFVDAGARKEHDAVLRSAGERALADASDGPPSQTL